jgi:hypothetical protein
MFSALKEYRRVIRIPQMLYLVGMLLIRVGIKYTTLASVIAFGWIIVSLVGDQLGLLEHFGWEPKQPLRAAAIPALIAISTIGLGHTLKGLSNLFYSERLLIANANALALMKDCKKAELRWHLGVLWERVFNYESRIHAHHDIQDERERITSHRRSLVDTVERWHDDLKNHFGISEENIQAFVRHVASFQPLSSGVEATREGFITSAAFAIQNSLPQKFQTALTGVDLSMLENWYDGAFFTVNDDKLKEQYVANKALRDIRQRAGIRWWTRFRGTLMGHPNPIWFNLTMKKIGVGVGGLIEEWNRKYVKTTESNFFDAQDFLWLDEQRDQLIEERFGQQGKAILTELRTTRTDLFRRVFSDNWQSAGRQILGMFGPDYRRGLELRFKFDIEFCGGLLDQTPEKDVADLQILLQTAAYPPDKLEKEVTRAKINLKKVDAALRTIMPDILDAPPTLRTVRMGYHLNVFGLQKWATKDPERARYIISEFLLRAESRYSLKICLLRQFYELGRIQIISYARMIKHLGDYGNSVAEETQSDDKIASGVG